MVNRKGVLALALTLVFLMAGPVMANEEDGGAPLNDSRFNVHGEFRVRGEVESNYQQFNDDGGFNDPAVPGGQIDDDTTEFFPYRFRLAFEGRITEDIFGQVEIQVGDLFGQDDNKQGLYETEDDAGELQLYTAFIHWNRMGGTDWNMRMGRQELTMGNEFLFGDLDYYNGISYDGWRVSYDGEPVTFDFFWAQEAEALGARRDSNIFAFDLGGSVDRGDEWSFYSSWVVEEEHHSGEDQLNLLTIGARWTRWEGEGSHFIWNAELAYQDGRHANPRVFITDLTAPDYGQFTGETDNDILIVAWGGEGAFGYQFARDNSTHKIYGHAYFATGDEDGGNEDESFRPMFQDIHDRLGKADIVQGTNIFSYGIAWEGTFADKHQAGADLMRFIIAEPDTDNTCLARGAGDFPLNDPSSIRENCDLLPDGGFQGWYIPAGDRLSGIDEDEDDLGQEIDLWYTYHMTDNLSFGAELSAFFPGDAITQLEDAVEFQGLAPTTAAFSSSHAPTQLAAQSQFLLNDDPVYRLSVQARLRF
jgi:hypothetical protein